MKAVLFCNYEQSLVNEKIRPKLAKFGVEVLRVVNVDRSGPVDTSRADILIYLVDLMSVGQKKKIKSIARNNKKRLISLQLQGTDWGKAFGDLSEEAAQGESQSAVNATAIALTSPSYLRAVPDAPPSEEELDMEEDVEEDDDPPPVSLPQDLALLSEFGEENQRLEREVRRLQTIVQTQDKRLFDATSAMGRFDELCEKLRQLQEEKDTAEKRLEDAAISIAKAQKEVDVVHATQRDLDTVRAQNKNQEEELARLRLSRPLAPPSSPLKKTQDFLAVRDAFKSLMRAGAMTKDEVLEKLMTWELKDS